MLRRNRLPSSFLLACSCLLVAAGCGKNEPPQGLPAEQVPAAVQSAFEEATPEVKDAAKEVVNSLQGKDQAKAFLELNTLSTRTDLTPAQREAASRSMLSLNESLRTAASQGDQRAAEALQVYRSTK